MPELPEVETIKNDLRKLVVGRRIEDVEVLDPRVVKHEPTDGFRRGMSGQTIVDVDRRAKYLLIELSSGRYLVVHLIITGQLLLVNPQTPLRRSTRLIAYLDNGLQLRLFDSSHFAQVHLVKPEEFDTILHLNELGPEPLTPRFTETEFAHRLQGRTAAIKPVLLNQHIIAGLGNIYTDEALFKARIHPLERANNLTKDQIHLLYHAINDTLRAAVAHRGTTTRAYRDVRGEKGGYQDYLQVFGRSGQPCKGCPGNIEQLTVGGRRTYICASCQRLSTAPIPISQQRRRPEKKAAS